MRLLEQVAIAGLVAILRILAVKCESPSDLYYWKQVEDKIPEDAVPGGFKGNLTTYIGQILYRGTALIPGGVHPSPLEIHYATWGTYYVGETNFKVLCSKYPENFEWVETTLADLKFLTHKHLVLGGHDDGYPLLIGKLKVDSMEEAVGKVTFFGKYEAVAVAAKSETYYRKEGEKFLVLAFKQPCIYDMTNVEKTILNEVHVNVYDYCDSP